MTRRGDRVAQTLASSGPHDALVLSSTFGTSRPLAAAALDDDEQPAHDAVYIGTASSTTSPADALVALASRCQQPGN